ncbi:MAG: helix-turn-helix transcriptional regulator, partial [Candidatus Omnitrophica bacterium]|nr:helix-turn-helix transcriptional regulator [Candidatus Omnitrophota bacterium]
MDKIEACATLGEQIRLVLKHRGYSIRKAAKIIGISRISMSDILGNKRAIHKKTLKLVAERLGVDSAVLKPSKLIQPPKNSSPEPAVGDDTGPYSNEIDCALQVRALCARSAKARKDGNYPLAMHFAREAVKLAQDKMPEHGPISPSSSEDLRAAIKERDICEWLAAKDRREDETAADSTGETGQMLDACRAAVKRKIAAARKSLQGGITTSKLGEMNIKLGAYVDSIIMSNLEGYVDEENMADMRAELLGHVGQFIKEIRETMSAGTDQSVTPAATPTTPKDEPQSMAGEGTKFQPPTDDWMEGEIVLADSVLSEVLGGSAVDMTEDTRSLICENMAIWTWYKKYGEEYDDWIRYESAIIDTFRGCGMSKDDAGRLLDRFAAEYGIERKYIDNESVTPTAQPRRVKTDPNMASFDEAQDAIPSDSRGMAMGDEDGAKVSAREAVSAITLPAAAFPITIGIFIDDVRLDHIRKNMGALRVLLEASGVKVFTSTSGIYISGEMVFSADPSRAHILLCGGLVFSCIRRKVEGLFYEIAKRPVDLPRAEVVLTLPLYAIQYDIIESDPMKFLLPESIATRSDDGHIRSFSDESGSSFEIDIPGSIQVIVVCDGRTLRVLNPNGSHEVYLNFLTGKTDIPENGISSSPGVSQFVITPSLAPPVVGPQPTPKPDDVNMAMGDEKGEAPDMASFDEAQDAIPSDSRGMAAPKGPFLDSPRKYHTFLEIKSRGEGEDIPNDVIVLEDGNKILADGAVKFDRHENTLNVGDFSIVATNNRYRMSTGEHLLTGCTIVIIQAFNNGKPTAYAAAHISSPDAIDGITSRSADTLDHPITRAMDMLKRVSPQEDATEYRAMIIGGNVQKVKNGLRQIWHIEVPENCYYEAWGGISATSVYYDGYSICKLERMRQEVSPSGSSEGYVVLNTVNLSWPAILSYASGSGSDINTSKGDPRPSQPQDPSHAAEPRGAATSDDAVVQWIKEANVGDKNAIDRLVIYVRQSVPQEKRSAKIKYICDSLARRAGTQFMRGAVAGTTKNTFLGQVADLIFRLEVRACYNGGGHGQAGHLVRLSAAVDHYEEGGKVYCQILANIPHDVSFVGEPFPIGLEWLEGLKVGLIDKETGDRIQVGTFNGYGQCRFYNIDENRDKYYRFEIMNLSEVIGEVAESGGLIVAAPQGPQAPGAQPQPSRKSESPARIDGTLERSGGPDMAVGDKRAGGYLRCVLLMNQVVSEYDTLKRAGLTDLEIYQLADIARSLVEGGRIEILNIGFFDMFIVKVEDGRLWINLEAAGEFSDPEYKGWLLHELIHLLPFERERLDDAYSRHRMAYDNLNLIAETSEEMSEYRYSPEPYGVNYRDALNNLIYSKIAAEARAYRAQILYLKASGIAEMRSYWRGLEENSKMPELRQTYAALPAFLNKDGDIDEKSLYLVPVEWPTVTGGDLAFHRMTSFFETYGKVGSWQTKDEYLEAVWAALKQKGFVSEDAILPSPAPQGPPASSAAPRRVKTDPNMASFDEAQDAIPSDGRAMAKENAEISPQDLEDLLKAAAAKTGAEKGYTIETALVGGMRYYKSGKRKDADIVLIVN